MRHDPIFIAGLERSGTSLIYALLASHPRIAMSRRTNLWTHFYDQYGDLGSPENFERCLNMMLRYKRLIKLKPDPARLRREFPEGEATYGRLFALLEEHYAEQLGKPRWGDKSLNTERYADPIFAAYPHARILHMIRDPRDRYASSLTRWKVKRGGIGAGTAMWLDSANLALSNRQRHPNQYRIVRYETLVRRPEETLQEICAFIGEEYSDVMLTMQGAQVFLDKGGNSSYGKRQPGAISTNSIGRFREVLSKRDIAFMQAYAEGEMAIFDYPLEPTEFAMADRLYYASIGWPSNYVRMVTWRMLNTFQNRKGRPVPSYRLISEASPTS